MLLPVIVAVVLVLLFGSGCCAFAVVGVRPVGIVGVEERRGDHAAGAQRTGAIYRRRLPAQPGGGETVADLYTLKRDDLFRFERMGEKLADNLLQAIAALRLVDPVAVVLFTEDPEVERIEHALGGVGDDEGEQVIADGEGGLALDQAGEVGRGRAEFAVDL